jgi:hypothetical protein
VTRRRNNDPISLQEPATAAWKPWVKDCERETAQVQKDYEAGKPVEITELYKRKSIKKEVYFSETGPFRGRCAYCETDIAVPARRRGAFSPQEGCDRRK